MPTCCTNCDNSIPEGVTVLSAPTPPEILADYRIDPDQLAVPDFAVDIEAWLDRQRPYDGPVLPQPANMIYTSGTTGHPKGVRRNAPTPEQSASAERMRTLIYGLKPGARALLPGPLYHSAPNSFGLRAARLGGALILMPRFEPEQFLRLIQDERIDTIFMVPTMFIPPDETARCGPPSIRCVFAPSRHSCRGSLSCGYQARDDRVVGPGHL